MTRKQAIKKELAYAKGVLTEKGYREFIAKWVTLSSEYFQNGGKFNIKDFEHKAI